MRIIDKNGSINEIVDLILNKARYQKVLICLDENSDIEFVENIIDKIKNQVVILKYYYNKHNVESLRNMINNGVRVVVYNVRLEYFYKLQSDNNYIINIFLPQSKFLLPYINNVESVYGDNLLVCNTMVKDYLSLIFLYEVALNKVWQMLVQDLDVDTSMFKNLDALANGDVDFYTGLANQVGYVKSVLTNDYKEVEESQIPYYIYLRLCYILKMLEELNRNNEQYIDFYKTEKSSMAVEKAYSLIIKHKLIELLKYNSGNLIKINCAVLNRIKIIIKKHFNFKNIKTNKLNKIIKNQSKESNYDNLLYISYILNSV